MRRGAAGASPPPAARPPLPVHGGYRADQKFSLISSQNVKRAVSFGNIGAIYVWLLIIVVFSLWKPEIFPTMNTVKAIANNFDASAIATLAILIPMASGTFDASVGGVISLTSVLCAWLLINTGWPIPVVIVLTLLAGAGVGLFNSLAVVVLRIRR